MDVKKLIKSFFEMIPLQELNWDEFTSGTLTLETQRHILRQTVLSPLGTQFPPSIKYRCLFVKQLLAKCEALGVDAADELYEIYSSLVSGRSDGQQGFFRTYFLPSGHPVTLRESLQLVSGGTTGLLTWPAGKYMAEWATENSNVFAGKRVMELGSGLGLTGLVICQTCCPSSYLFSDGHRDVLKTLQGNITLNRSRNNHCASTESLSPESRTSWLDSQRHKDKWRGEVTEEESAVMDECQLIGMGEWHHEQPSLSQSDCEDSETREEALNSRSWRAQWCASERMEGSDQPLVGRGRVSTEISLCCFDWEDVSADWLVTLRADVILAADVSYDTRIVPALVWVLGTLLDPLRNHPDSHREFSKPAAYVACTVRSDESHGFFVDMLRAANLDVVELAPPKNRFMSVDKNCAIQVLRLTKKSRDEP